MSDEAAIRFGCDLTKWFITCTDTNRGKWAICPPSRLSANTRWFRTGAEALAAFAKGGAK